jgi:hypothetical protein
MGVVVAAVQLVPVVVGGSALFGCSYIDCFDGMLPFNGQTGVPVDAVLTIETHYGLNPDTPSLQDAITLERLGSSEADSGEPVSFELDVDLESAIVRIVPTEPLVANSWYELRGVDRNDLGGAHYMWMGRSTARKVRFYTGSAPRLVRALIDRYSQDGDTGGSDQTVVLIFSEAMDIESVFEAVEFTDFDETVYEPTLLGHWEEQDHMVAFSVSAAAEQVVVGVDALAETGADLVEEASTSLEYSNYDESWTDPWVGHSFCGEYW